MSQEIISELINEEVCCAGDDGCPRGPEPKKIALKKKRDIFRFNGQEDMSINLEHVHKIVRSEKRITFQLPATADYVDFESEEVAKVAYDQILTAWASDVVA